MQLLVGLPYSSDGRLAQEIRSMPASVGVMVSAGSFFRKGKGFGPVGPAVFQNSGAVALDSAGFVAMMQGGYRWSVSEYVEFVAQARAGWGFAGQAFPWRFWSSMDYCCEPEIAGQQSIVDERVQKTATTLAQILEEVDYWRNVEGDTELTDPLPILQGWSVEDYVRSAVLTKAVLTKAGRDWPALVGLGSVCRRSVHHPTHGLLAILKGLSDVLPKSVKLHLFGVKGTIIAALDQDLYDRIGSVDSMAWDFACRKSHPKAGRTVEMRAQFMGAWVSKQQAVIDARNATSKAPAPANRKACVCPRCSTAARFGWSVEVVFGTRPRTRASGTVVRVPQSWCRDCRRARNAA